MYYQRFLETSHPRRSRETARVRIADDQKGRVVGAAELWNAVGRRRSELFDPAFTKDQFQAELEMRLAHEDVRNARGESTSMVLNPRTIRGSKAAYVIECAVMPYPVAATMRTMCARYLTRSGARKLTAEVGNGQVWAGMASTVGAHLYGIVTDPITNQKAIALGRRATNLGSYPGALGPTASEALEATDAGNVAQGTRSGARRAQAEEIDKTQTNFRKSQYSGALGINFCLSTSAPGSIDLAVIHAVDLGYDQYELANRRAATKDAEETPVLEFVGINEAFNPNAYGLHMPGLDKAVSLVQDYSKSLERDGGLVGAR